ncbi:MAG: PSD1 and planctomycete cytochrome C domain-containing protein, partial [Chthoniobacteraceae bacterium]
MKAVSILLGALLPAALAFAAPAKPNTAKVPPATATAADPTMMAGEGDSMTMMGAKTAEVTPEQAAFFESKIAPLFSDNCYKCHSVERGKSKGGLTMDSKEGLAKGGETGVLFEGKDPAKSLLITAVSYKDPDLQMPPKGDKLSASQIADLVAWVKMGAPDPRKSNAAIVSKLSGLTDKARSHWAFQPIKKPEIPAIRNRAWCKTPVDAFIMEKLEAKDLLPTPGLLDRADNREKETLIRRATYDLLGLPPTPAEIDSFTQDTSPQAFARVVERLLASPHYGERWGRFWLDTARYADTVGGNRDRDKDYRFPYAWTYRDWVIDAFNSDMPYDQFIFQQLAADLIPNNSEKNLPALGFITVGERFGNQNDNINDQIDTVTKGFVGLTVACARCHDHMFDPIPTEDYYALHGIFSSIREPDDLPMINKPDPKLLKEFQQKIASYEETDRKTYYDLLEEAAAGFREKAVPYLMVAYLQGRRNNEKALKERDALITEHGLDEQFAGFVRGQIRGDHPVFGPIKEFLSMPDGDIGDFIGARKAKEIAEDKRYVPAVREAFRGFKPQHIEDIIQLYEKVFAGSGERAKQAITAAREATDKKTPLAVEQSDLQLAAAPFQIAPAYEMTNERIRRAIDAWPQRLRNKGQYHFAAINELKLTDDGAPAKAMIVEDHDPRNSQVFIRGQSETRGDSVPRSFLEILSPGGKRQPFHKGSGRLELAQAIASKSNPLTARVLVNRVWMHHFGEGFVRTPDDLGTQSEAPSHSELLDYLASYLMERNWSLKDLH